MNQPYHNRYGFLLLVCENFQRADTKTMCPQELCGDTIGSGGSPQGVRVLPSWRHRSGLPSLSQDSVRGRGCADTGFKVGMPCAMLALWRGLSQPHISSEIQSYFITAFIALTLCKFRAYFALKWFNGVITLCENAGQISAELSVTVTSIRDGNFTLQFLPTRTVINAV